MAKKITLIGSKELPTSRDGSYYQYRFSMVDTSLIGKPEEKFYTTYHKIGVGISGSIEATWLASQENINFIKVCYEFGKRELIQKVKDGSIQDRQELVILSTNYPEECPFQSDRIDYDIGASTVFEVGDKIMEDVSLLQIASSIIDKRDFINAILKERYGKKLFLLNAERDLLQLFRSANSIEEFIYSINSLSFLVKNMNLDLLREITGANDNTLRSISLLENYLKIYDEYDEEIISTFRSINRLRQMHPVHGDNVDGVQEAHTYFRIEYPISNHSEAWKKVLISYRDTLLRIFEIIKKPIVSDSN